MFVFGGSAAGPLGQDEHADTSTQITALSEKEQLLLKQLMETRKEMQMEMETRGVVGPGGSPSRLKPLGNTVGFLPDSSTSLLADVGGPTLVPGGTAGAGKGRRKRKNRGAPGIGAVAASTLPAGRLRGKSGGRRKKLAHAKSLPSLGVRPSSGPEMGGASAAALGLGSSDDGEGEGDEYGPPVRPIAQLPPALGLPVFQLPKVKPAWDYTSGTAGFSKGDGDRWVDLKHETRDDKERMKKVLGLTDKDLKLMRLQQRAKMQGRQFELPDVKAPVTKTKALTEHRPRHKRRGPPPRCKPRSTPRALRTDAISRGGPASTSTMLRKELGSSLAAVEGFTAKVKAEMVEIQRIVPPELFRQRNYLQKWGATRFSGIMDMIRLNRLRFAVDTWKNFCVQTDFAAKQAAVSRYKCTRVMARLFRNYEMGAVGDLFDRWKDEVEAQIAAELAEAMRHGATEMQRIVRGYQARCFRAFLEDKALQALRDQAARVVQSFFRTMDAKRRGKELIRRIVTGRSAIQIQRIIRGYLARRYVERLRVFMRRHKASSKIQALWRGIMVRRRLEFERMVILNESCAVTIQAAARGYFGRKIARERRRELAKIELVKWCQRRWRGCLARNLVRALRREKARQLAVENHAATQFQKVYRGHRGRLIYELELHKKMLIDKRRNAAATRIQCNYKGYLTRSKLSKLKEEKFKEYVRRAHEWKEIHDDSAGRSYFFNEASGHSLWEPPVTGYTKLDGKLVLGNGKIIEDPGPEDEEELLMKKQVCVECEVQDATLTCDQCDDVYCKECWESTHSTGKRARHTTRPLGSLVCIECEERMATKWCLDCDDPYCDTCYKSMHRRGKKQKHEWRDALEYNDGKWDGDGDPRSKQKREKAEKVAQEMAAAEASAAAWGGVPSAADAANAMAPAPAPAPVAADPAAAQSSEAYDPTYDGYDEGYGEGGYDEAAAGGATEEYDTTYTGGMTADTDYGYGEGAVDTTWQEWTDPDSGAPYWYNTVTAETTWKNPYG